MAVRGWPAAAGACAGHWLSGGMRAARPYARAQRVGRGWVRLHLELDALGDEVARVLPLDALAEARVEVRDDHRDGWSRTGIAHAIGAHLIRGGPYHARNRASGVYEQTSCAGARGGEVRDGWG